MQDESFAFVLISELNSKQSSRIIRLAATNCLIIGCRRFGFLGTLIQVIQYLPDKGDLQRHFLTWKIQGSSPDIS